MNLNLNFHFPGVTAAVAEITVITVVTVTVYDSLTQAECPGLRSFST